MLDHAGSSRTTAGSGLRSGRASPTESSRIATTKCTRRLTSLTMLEKAIGERRLAILIRVIEEVVLELVERDEQRAHLRRPAAQRVEQRLAGLPMREGLPRRSPRRPPLQILLDQCREADRHTTSLKEQTANGARAAGRLEVREDPLVQIADHARLQQRALADAALDRRRSSGEKLAGCRSTIRCLLVATEEELRILLPVGNQTDVRRWPTPPAGSRIPRLSRSRWRRRGQRGFEPFPHTA